MAPLIALLAGLLMLMWTGGAAAHPMPESRVWIDTTPHGVRLTLQLPLNRLEYAFGLPLADAPATVLPRHQAALSRYVLQHVGVFSNGQRWQALAPQLAVEGQDASAELKAVLELRAPPGADPRRPTLVYDAVMHEVRTHRALVFLRNDWAGGVAGRAPLPLGELHPGAGSLPLVLAPVQPGAAFWRLLQAGAAHIAEGTDHLLFLLLLLVVAPLRVQQRRWAGLRPTRQGLWQLAAVVSAFTVGHSVTLALGSTGWLVLPSRPVEVAVAVSIIVAALHAWRPLMARGEIALAGGFGLVHGLAFSASLQGAGLTAAQHALALLAFNLGIEAMQLAVLAAVLPPLWLLAHGAPAAYGRLRMTLACLAALAAALWVAERLGADVAQASAWTTVVARQAPRIAALLWVLATWQLWRSPRPAKAGV